MARRTSTCARCARYSLLALTSLGGSVPSAACAAASAGEAPAASASSTPACPQRGRPHARETDLHAIADTGGGDGNRRPVLRAPHVLEIRPRRDGRHPDLGEDLLPLERGLERADEELHGRDRPFPTRSTRDEIGVEREQDGRQVGGRIAMRDRAADRASVTHLRIADQRSGLRDHRTMLREHRVARELSVPCERTDRDPIAVLTDVTQLVEASDVDEQRGTRDAQAHGGNERVPAGEKLRVLVAAEQGNGLIDRLRPLVVEGRGNHEPARAAAWTAWTMLWYPVQRQRLPSSPRRISSSDGFGFSSRSEIAAITNPGVQ